jgi:hypothetical protein
MKLENPKKLPESMLRMILSEMIKEGLTYDDCETIYESHDMDTIDTVLKKFGITEIDYEDYGFFAMLLIENPNPENNKLTIPKVKNYTIHFKTIVKKVINEFWELPIKSYNRNYVSDMVYNGDFSYYDGDMVDDDVSDSETIDWEISDIVLDDTQLNESRNKKNVLLENRNERQKELRELNKLKMIIEQRIRLLTP